MSQQEWHAEGITPSAGQFYPANRVASLLDTSGFVWESDGLGAAAQIIEGEFQTGRERYLRVFRQVELLDPPSGEVEKNMEQDTLDILLSGVQKVLSEHNKRVADKAESASRLVEKYPHVLYVGPADWHEEVESLERVKSFGVDTRPGESTTWVGTVLAGGASLVLHGVAVCNIAEFSEDIQDSLAQQLLE